MEKKTALNVRDMKHICKRIADGTEFVVKTPKSKRAYVITGASRIFKENTMIIALHAELEDDG